MGERERLECRSPLPHSCGGFGLQGLVFGFRVTGFGLRVKGFGFRVCGLRFEVYVAQGFLKSSFPNTTSVSLPHSTVQQTRSGPDSGLGLQAKHFKLFSLRSGERVYVA